jgi:outer membrane protein OmpA-like peptidoglycan-associated protein
LPPRANDGCPAEDWDQDGVARAQDRCPNAKEDGAAPNTADGCPSNDQDGDGVADSLDGCATKAEDNLPPQPGDGCPAGDADGDGVADATDRCPNEAETRNDFRDEDGCPDERPGGAEVAYDPASRSIYVPESRRIEFERGASELDARDLETVQAVAAVLLAHPEIERLEIEGHASSVGDPAANRELTERRARAVARALTERRVQARRLVPVGYGEYCPALDRGDEVDEPANRRVLFKTVVVSGQWQDVARGCWRAQSAGIDPTARRPYQPAPATPNPGGPPPGNPGTPVVDPTGGA